MKEFEYPPKIGWCTKHASTTVCKDCEIDTLTARVAELEAFAHIHCQTIAELRNQLAEQQAQNDCLTLDNERYRLKTAEEISDEYTKMAQWIEELEKTYLQMRKGQLIGYGMKIDQAAIHAKFQLDSAKVQFFSKA